MVLYIVAPPNLVCNSMSIDWNMGAACYASVAGATSRDPYSLILIGIGRCVLRLYGASLQSPNSIEAWELRATPLCGSYLQNPYPCMLALLGAHHRSHMSLGRVYSVYEMMAFGAGY